ncbi:DUF416 family protein [Nostoc sp.]|uniref:DUF416 family protein n=1 Tax=Nostoc sp. TaxID=1180 RepID=UPI002FF9319F
MNLKYGEFDILERELEALPPMHRVAFAAACCKRLYPHYDIYLRAARIELCLEQIPQQIILVAKEIDETLFMYIDYLTYESEDKKSQDISDKQLLQLEIRLDPSVQQTISVTKEIHETLFEYIDYLCQSEDEYSEDISHEELVEIIANHPFTVREMAKQSEDLRRLRETPTLTPEFLQWLRTSSQNGGKSLLDLS